MDTIDEEIRRMNWLIPGWSLFVTNRREYVEAPDGFGTAYFQDIKPVLKRKQIEVEYIEPKDQETFWRDMLGWKELIIREFDGSWWRSASRYCQHVPHGGECMYCALVLEGDDDE